MQIPSSTFYSILSSLVDDNVSSEEAKQIQKVKDMLERFPCFKDDHVPGKFVYKNVRAQSKPPVSFITMKKNKVLSYQEKVSRETVSILNKINDSNFDVIFDKLQRFCDVNNAEIIANKIIFKCCTQEYYADIFLKMLQFLHQKFPTQLDAVFTEFKKQTLDGFQHDTEGMSIKAQSTYDEYCDFVLERNILVQKHKILMIFVLQNLIDIDIKAYIDLLCLELKTSGSVIKIDLIATIMTQVNDVLHHPYLVNNVAAIVNDESFCTLCSKKTRFMLLDLVDCE